MPGSKPCSPSTLAKWVKFAEELAAQNGGYLPGTSDLRKSGMPGMLGFIHAMTSFPESFARLRNPNPKVGRDRVSLESYVKEAERLAAENGGAIPTPSRMTQDGHFMLINMLRTNPEAFAHIPREFVDKRTVAQPPTKTIEFYVQQAEKIAAENNGVLPPLKDMTHFGKFELIKQIRRNPEAFEHIRKGWQSYKKNKP